MTIETAAMNSQQVKPPSEAGLNLLSSSLNAVRIDNNKACIKEAFTFLDFSIVVNARLENSEGL